MWHKRFGHPGADALRRLVNTARGVRLTYGKDITIRDCDACGLGKMKRQVRRQPRESVAFAAPGDRLAIDFHDFDNGYNGYTSAMVIGDRVTGLAWDFYL
ncbi:hypothetical protein DL766_003980 [Monosporascus sp. MC13-8B]|uniref:GAG-pre-integrase domain-containing protein n=1 Tax=Monosporascus cannonballus TaxID=155416 RepID=A0ABY0HB18_9PEZI|nr:hypothetical protein DL762_004386 [Monosporascus cannonballus]RYO91017.1 hypothetical protein DL763_005095 [Monosporascus cannonballus]RYP32402.1 hypothetical protein DL766_003980 [Monosporascus sp. MC13-8B]